MSQATIFDSVAQPAPPTGDAVIRAFTRTGQRPCARPGCTAPAIATLRFTYERRDAWVEALADAPDPQSYDLCARHLARTRAPNGWRLRDRRPVEQRHADAPPVTPADLGSERTIAVLAAALRASPVSVPENGRERTRPIERPRSGAGVPAHGGGPPTRSTTAAAPPGSATDVSPPEPASVPAPEAAAPPVDPPLVRAGGPGFATDW